MNEKSDLYMAGNLFLSAFDTVPLEMVDEELVAPATAAATLICVGREQVLLKAWEEV